MPTSYGRRSTRSLPKQPNQLPLPTSRDSRTTATSSTSGGRTPLCRGRPANSPFDTRASTPRSGSSSPAAKAADSTRSPALAEQGLRGGWIATDVARAPLWRTEIASGYEAGPERLTIDQLPLYPQHLWLQDSLAAVLDVGLAGAAMPISDGVQLTGTREQMRSVLHPLNGLLSVVGLPSSAYWLEGPVATAFVAADTYQALQERQRGEHTRQEVSLVRPPRSRWAVRDCSRA
ncbi:MAG: hypothetical protein R2710_12995 [Acidimicrobiales bacterium]